MIKTENAVSGGPGFSFNTWGDFLLGNVLNYSRVAAISFPTCITSTVKPTCRMTGS